jgi:cytochrome c-type biogenesis protein CcmH
MSERPPMLPAAGLGRIRPATPRPPRGAAAAPLPHAVAAAAAAAPATAARAPRPGRAARLAALLAALLCAAPALAAIGDPAERLADPAQEARAQALGRELRCMVCQNQSIEDSDADLARDLRRLVREQIAAGGSDAQVMRFVHDRYGDFVLLRPPVNATTALLWATPVLALAGGALLVLAMRRRAATAAAAPPPGLTEAERARLARLEDGGAAG